MFNRRSFLRLLSFIAILSMIFSNIQPVTAQGSSGDGIRRQVNAESGKVSFIGPESGRSVSAARTLGTSIRPQNPAMALAKRFALEFGVKNPERDLVEMKNNRGKDGRQTVRFQQKYQGIPVMGGELIVDTNDNGDLYSMSGEVSPNISISTQPKIDAKQAQTNALQSMAKWYGKKAEDFVASESVLWIYDESLLQESARPVELVWRIEVTAKDQGMPMRELVLVNAQRGGISLHFNQIDTAWNADKKADTAPTSTPEPPQLTETPLPTEPTNEIATPTPMNDSLPSTAETSALQAANLDTTLYVSTTGNDTNDCKTTSTPCATIDGALVKINAGDTIRVAQGTYSSGRINGIVVYITTNVILSGGWDNQFLTQTGNSIIDGMARNYGMNINASATIDHFTIQNANGVYGGGITSSATSLMLDSVFIGNNSANYGAGIYIYSGNVVLNNSTISGNKANLSGGGIFFQAGSLTINNSTIVGNNASVAGGYYNYGSSITLRNSILAKNTAASYPDCYGIIGTSDHNIIGTTTGCTINNSQGDKFNLDPLVGDIPVGKFGYQPLLANSPAINAGNPATCLSIDQRGISRPQGAACDIGSYEYTSPGPIVAIDIMSGDNQISGPGFNFASPLTVYARDSIGSPISGVNITFRTPISGASAVFVGTGNQASVTTNQSGVAVSAVLTSNEQLGAFSVTAEITGNPSISTAFALRNSAWYVSPTGNNNNACNSKVSTCATIDGVLGKTNYAPGDVIFMAKGTYIGTGSQVVSITKRTYISGGWTSDFATQNGYSIIDGETTRKGIYINVIGMNYTTTLDHLIVKNGYAEQGGGIQIMYSAVTIRNSSIYNNQAGEGGGIDTWDSTLSLINSTISNNRANNNGGGLFFSDLYEYHQLTINNSTIVYNLANSWGGGIYLYGGNGAQIINNTIIAHNSASGSPDCYANNLTSASQNIVLNTANCNMPVGSNNSVDPKVTASLVEDYGFYAIYSDSPAINTGNSEYCPSVDQRGVSRPQGSGCDIGAYERPLSIGSPASLLRLGGSNQRTPPGSPYSFILTAQVLDANGNTVEQNGIPVTFTAPASGPSLNFGGPATVMTDQFGVARSPQAIANQTSGAFTVDAASSGLSTAHFELTNIAWFVSPGASGGNDNNSCSLPTSPCASISAVFSKPGFVAGDTVKVAQGNYVGTDMNVVSISNAVKILGGWNYAFTQQVGYSTIDGENVHRGVFVNVGSPVTGEVILDHLIVKNGLGSAGGYAWGGAISISSSTVVIMNSWIHDNVSAGYSGGGGILSREGDLTILNSTISGNKSYGYGGGVYFENYGNIRNLVINNSTIVYNNTTNDIYGGGIYVQNGYFSLKNSIIAHNVARSTSSDCYGKITEAGHNIIMNPNGCDIPVGANQAVDPLITASPVGNFGYYALFSNSPAIDHGDPASCLSTDQKGTSRPQGPTCDIGAYERPSCIGTAASLEINMARFRLPFGQAASFPLSVMLVDANGNPVDRSNVQVTFSAPITGPRLVFAGSGTNESSTLTNQQGIAVSSVISANEEFGEYSAQAVASGVGSITIHLTNTAWFVTPTGNYNNMCTTPDLPCVSINSVLDKPEFMAGDTILLSEGVYTNQFGSAISMLNKNVYIWGGWKPTFVTHGDKTILDGQNNCKGIWVLDNVTATIRDLSIHNGNANTTLNDFSGGGLANYGTLSIFNVDFLNNHAGFYGGAISNWGNLTVFNSIIEGNSANNGGGGVYNTGVLTLRNLVIADNTAMADGGGIYQYSGQIIAENVTISNNLTQSNGAGVYVHDGDVVINNGTITQNIATNEDESAANGGGLSNRVDKPVTLRNTIVAGNSAPSGPDCSGHFSSGGHNLIGYGVGCSLVPSNGDQIGTWGKPLDAKLGNLLDNGGDTLTHALLIGSPAINAGDPVTCAATDQRGIARPQGAACDIGAFEGSVSQTVMGIVKTYIAGDKYGNHNNLPGIFICDQTNLTCAVGDADAKAAHQYAIGTYDFFKNKHNRNGIDQNNMPIISSVHYNVGYDNAFWNGAQMIYGDAHGYALADDVVAHELTHGVTQYESNLFYYYQSGAINESLSDVFGEYYDQTNGLGNDAANVKWLVGEDATGLGAMRSMSNPPAYGDPDKMTSTLYYKTAGDSGGVHHNSGVNNKAVYLMVDGGTFNGRTVAVLGWDKVGALYYEVNTNLLTSGADYSDLYYALQQACLNLTGQKGVTSADCVQVKNALDAVEMNSQPVANFNTDAAMCPTAGTGPSVFFSDDLETGAGNWTFNNGASTRWQYDSPWGQYAQSRAHFLYADDYPPAVTDARAQLVAWKIPAGAYLWFAHAYDFEIDTSHNYDGGVLEYSTNGGSSWTDAKSLIQVNGYNGKVASGWNNPLANRNAFVGASHGYISTRVNMASLSGKTVSFRWRMGLDTEGYNWGWWVDNIKLYTCVTPLTISGNADSPNVTLSYMDGNPKTVLADASGNYTITVPYGWSGTITPSKTGLVFEPASRTYTNLQSNQTAQNYIVPTFADVPVSHPFFRYIEAFYRAGITSGCSQSPKMYCPDNLVTRAEMAVFIERAKGNFNPQPNLTGMFADMPYLTFTPFIEQFYNDGITTGCSSNPLMYCPTNNVNRAEMATFIERAIGHFNPQPNPSGMFSDVPSPGLEGLTKFIEQFYNDGITTGCSLNPLMYCPTNNVTRAEMAVFIVRAFHIPLP